MREDLTDKLCKDFPLLYKYLRGFECSDGWEPLIRSTSKKLEKKIKLFLEDKERNICDCGHKEDEHSTLGCKYIYKAPILQIRLYRSRTLPKNKFSLFLNRLRYRLFGTVGSQINKLFWWLSDHTFIYKNEPCVCKEFSLYHPYAVQIKEKFGGLRIYMAGNIEGMFDIIDKAERKSYKICEFCGAPGKTRDGSWIFTLCDKCNEENVR